MVLNKKTHQSKTHLNPGATSHGRSVNSTAPAARSQYRWRSTGSERSTAAVAVAASEGSEARGIDFDSICFFVIPLFIKQKVRFFLDYFRSLSPRSESNLQKLNKGRDAEPRNQHIHGATRGNLGEKKRKKSDLVKKTSVDFFTFFSLSPFSTEKEKTKQ